MNYYDILIIVAIATIIYLIKNRAQNQASNQAPAESTDKAPTSENDTKVNGKYQPKNKVQLQILCSIESINLGDIDTSLITDMSELFDFTSRKDFSGIESWDTSNVTDMSSMFCGASNFNQPIGSWDVSKVTDMRDMFRYAKSFNQSLDKWDISNVEDMTGMFYDAEKFNKPLYSWNERKLKSAFIKP